MCCCFVRLTFFTLCSMQFIFGSRIFENPSYNILILTSPMASQSHSIYFDGIAKQLASRGHQVTHHCRGQLEATKGVRNYVKTYDTDEFLFKALFDLDAAHLLFDKFFRLYPEAITDAINKTYNEPLLQDLMHGGPLNGDQNNNKYDVVLVDIFMCETYLPLVKKLGVPTILVSPFMLLAHFAWDLNVPYPYLLNFLGLPHSTAVATRTKNLIMHLSIMSYFRHYMFWIINGVIGHFLPANSPPLRQLLTNVSFMMTANPYSVNDAIPSTPFVYNLGCVHCTRAKPLPQDLEEVMQRSGEHGVIYFSMGSIVKSNWMAKEFQRKIVDVLSQLPQLILWKGKKLTGKKNLTNFHFREWFPQQDLVAHPKLRLVINTGGLGTMQEVSYHGSPILGFPMGNDHFYSMKVAKENGNGEALDWRTFTAQQLHDTITKMLTDKSYKESALRASVRMRDVLDSPSSQAAYWTEYIVRHKGAPFLKSPAQHLSWHQYFLIDVFALVLTLSTLAAILGCLAVKLSLKIFHTHFKHMHKIYFLLSFTSKSTHTA